MIEMRVNSKGIVVESKIGQVKITPECDNQLRV